MDGRTLGHRRRGAPSGFYWGSGIHLGRNLSRAHDKRCIAHTHNQIRAARYEMSFSPGSRPQQSISLWGMGFIFFYLCVVCLNRQFLFCVLHAGNLVRFQNKTHKRLCDENSLVLNYTRKMDKGEAVSREHLFKSGSA